MYDGQWQITLYVVSPQESAGGRSRDFQIATGRQLCDRPDPKDLGGSLGLPEAVDLAFGPYAKFGTIVKDAVERVGRFVLATAMTPLPAFALSTCIV